jgi:fatty-acyl-CoA synthase
MQRMGIGRGDHVGILMGNDEKWLSLFYGAALIGAVTVPVNTRLKSDEIRYCIEQADCEALFYVERFLNIDFAPMVRGLNIGQGRRCPARFRRESFRPSRSSRMTCCSSSSPPGTTAHPKGAMLTHDNMLRDAWAAGTRVGIRADDRYFNCRPFFHVAGSTLSALMALVAGATLVTLPTFEAGAALELMERERCTLVSGNDTIFQMLMGHEDFPSASSACAAAGPRRGRRPCAASSTCSARRRSAPPTGFPEASPNVVMSDWRDAKSCASTAAETHDGVSIENCRRGNPGARLERDEGLLQQPRGERRRPLPPTAGCAPGTSASSPPTAG